LMGALVGTIALIRPSVAAEQLTLKFGPFQQTVAVAEIERYAKTGQVPASLQLYSPLLSSNLRQALTTKVEIDPQLGQHMLQELMASPTGKQLLDTLKLAVPGVSVETLQASLLIAARQVHGLTPIGLLKAIPQQSITLDVTQAISIASKFNWAYWKSQAMSSLLQSSLKVETTALPLPFDPAATGTARVNQTSMQLADARRNRRLAIDLYVPDAAQEPLPQAAPAPVVVIVPGYEANKRFLAYLARHLASHGIAVVALEHPSAAQGGKLTLDALIPPQEFIDRPQDVSFVLDQLEQLNQTLAWRDRFSTQRVTVIGHSLGGYVAMVLAGAQVDLDHLRQFCAESKVLERVPADWLQCAAAKLPEHHLQLREPRVAQIVALNPAIGQMFGPEGLARVTTPTLILSGTEDALTPALSQQFQPFLQLPSPKYLLTAIGTTHLSVSDPNSFSGAGVQSTLLPERWGAEVEPLRQTLKGISLAFVQQLTPQAKDYALFLQPGYAQSFSTDRVILRLNQELPTNIRWLLSLAAGL
jgi:predicted dienelactone hydrolase